MRRHGSIHCESQFTKTAAVTRLTCVLTVLLASTVVGFAQDNPVGLQPKWVLSRDMTPRQIEQAIRYFEGLKNLPPFRYVEKRDYHPEPFRKVVVLGESHVATRNGWVNMFGELLRDAQGTEPLEVINAGIGGNAISPRSPGYGASARPSATERFREDVIAQSPDLVIISYGLNDMRAGMEPVAFREDLSHVIGQVRMTVNPVIVLTTMYNMSTYDLYPPFDKGNVEATEVYNQVIRQVAEEHDCLVADIWKAESQAPWLISVDTVHANRLGHRVIAHCVFHTVVTNCSGAVHAVKPPVSNVKAELERKHQGAIDRVIQRLEALKGEESR